MIPNKLRISAAFLVLLFYGSHFHYHYSWNRPADSFWMCNVSNLVLAAGLLLNRAVLIRVAALWLIPGIPLWLWDMLRTSDTHFTTFLTHVGGTIVSLLALRAIGYRKETWKYALLYAGIAYLFSRFFTPPELNVNLAHTFYPGWELIFSHYWQYLWFVFLQTTAGLYLLSPFLEKIFPLKHPQ